MATLKRTTGLEGRFPWMLKWSLQHRAKSSKQTFLHSGLLQLASLQEHGKVTYMYRRNAHIVFTLRRGSKK
jgi:hypothetical protein